MSLSPAAPPMSLSPAAPPVIASTTDWTRFIARATDDPVLFARLDIAHDRDAFADLAVRIGTELGLGFTVSEVHTALERARRTRLERHCGAAPDRPAPARPCPDSWMPRPPAGWLPAHLDADSAGPFALEWTFFGEHRLQDPFFEQSLASLLKRPARLLFTRHTGFDVLEDLAETSPDLAISGFVFHMSRCGSTLFAQALAADPRHAVLSEPPFIDQLLEHDAKDASLTFERRVARLRGLVHAYARRRRPEEERLFIKFDAWHTIHLPVIRAAFPATPWIFLHRDPVEVLVSQRRMRGAKFIPGAISPDLFGVESPEFSEVGFEIHTARLLGVTCQAALEALSTPGSPGVAVDYRVLRDRLPPLVRDHFGAPADDQTHEALAAALHRNAKNPAVEFEDDTAAKQREADDRLRALAATHLASQRTRLLALAERR